jgi:hypothetical protein
LKETVSIPYDLIGEWVALRLKDYYAVSFGDISLSPSGMFGRTRKSDIDEVLIGDINERPTIALKVNREGIYDLLPEGLFHINSDKVDLAVDNSKGTFHDQIQKSNAIEDEARRFFRIFELQIFRFRVVAEALARIEDTNLGVVESFLHTLFPVAIKELNRGEISRLLRAFPIFYYSKHDPNKIREVLAYVLDVPIDIEETMYTESIRLSGEGLLGSGELGIHTCLLGTFNYTECKFTVSAYLGAETIGEDAVNQIFTNKLRMLCDWLLPVSLDYKLKLLRDDRKNIMRLDLENCRLGVDNCLN